MRTDQDVQGAPALDAARPADAPVAAPPLTGFSPARLREAAHRAGFVLDSGQELALEALREGAQRGVYLWGPVGRGKSWLMDAVFQSLDTPRKQRTHFHRFFAELHPAIFRAANDIERALDELLADAEVLCFDEFHLHDVGDAMLALRLVDALIRRPVRLLITSNYAPEGLLHHPMHHQLFLPAIEQLREHLTVVSLDAGVDYRTRGVSGGGFASGSWRLADAPTDPAAGGPAPGKEPVTLTVNGRPLLASSALWDGTPEGELTVSFSALCEEATAPSDYLELSARFPRWRLLGVPDLADIPPSVAQRFGNLVDVLADQGTRVDFVSVSLPANLLLAEEPPLDVDRTLSRLGMLRRSGPESSESP